MKVLLGIGQWHGICAQGPMALRAFAGAPPAPCDALLLRPAGSQRVQSPYNHTRIRG